MLLMLSLVPALLNIYGCIKTVQGYATQILDDSFHFNFFLVYH